MKFWRKQNRPDELRRYLLGSLPDDQREALEKEVLTNTAVYEDLLSQEDELVDQYLTNQLNESERKQFETHFAVSLDHQRKVVFAKSLHTYLHSLGNPQEDFALAKNRPEYKPAFSRRPLFATSLVLVMFAVALVLAWVIVKKQMSVAGVRQSVVVTLVPGATRSDGASIDRISRPPLNSVTTIKLEFAENDYQNYAVELFKEGQRIATFAPQLAQPTGGHFVVTVDVDSNLLSTGDYVIKLSGMSGSEVPELKGQYNLRIVP